MNKKLFSWKALAGLALLVAMGMTSCKNTTEVDPNDPYNVNKPTKPGSKVGGSYDWEVTITSASDLTTQWNSVKDKVMKAVADASAGEVNFLINGAGYELDGGELAIPNAFATVNGKTVNVTFTGFKKAEKELYVNTKNLTGAEVNITLPAGEFMMKLDASTTKTTLSGDATLKELTATASTTKKLALTIKGGVTVKAIDMTGALADVKNVQALLVNANPAIEKGKGYKIGSEDLFVKSLVLKKSATVSGADETALENITIYEGQTLTLGNKKAQVDAIVGLGDMSKADKRNTIKFAGDADDFSKIKSIKNAHLEGTTATNLDDMGIFENVVFDIPVILKDKGAANTVFNKNVTVKIAEDVNTIKFSSINFGKKASINFDGSTNVVTSKALVKMFEYDKSTKQYVAVKDDDAANLSPANAKGTEAVFKYKTSDYSGRFSTWASITAAKIYVTDKFHFDKIEDAEKALKAAKEAYDKVCASDGYDYANRDNYIGMTKEKYIAAWEVLNGDSKVSYEKGKPLKIEKADPQKNKGLYKDYEDEWKFVGNANKAIDGSDYFTLYRINEEALVPELVSLEFAADCTRDGKALDAEALNDMCTWPTFDSVADAWLIVSYGDEVYKWKKTTSWSYILK